MKSAENGEGLDDDKKGTTESGSLRSNWKPTKFRLLKPGQSCMRMSISKVDLLTVSPIFMMEMVSSETKVFIAVNNTSG